MASNGPPRTTRKVRSNVYPGTTWKINRSNTATSIFVISVTMTCVADAYPCAQVPRPTSSPDVGVRRTARAGRCRRLNTCVLQRQLMTRCATGRAPSATCLTQDWWSAIRRKSAVVGLDRGVSFRRRHVRSTPGKPHPGIKSESGQSACRKRSCVCRELAATGWLSRWTN